MNNSKKVYLIFHRNRLTLITMSALDPALVDCLQRQVSGNYFLGEGPNG